MTILSNESGNYGLPDRAFCGILEVQEKDGIVQHAAKPIYINFLESNMLYAVASGDIEPDNCVVHALDYNFTLGDEE